MEKRCEIWGSGPDSGFLAGLLAEAGWKVKWVRPPVRQQRLRPLKFRRSEESQLKRLLLRYGLYQRPFGNALHLQNFYDSEILTSTFVELAECLRVDVVQVFELPILSQNEKSIIIVNEDPSFLEHWGPRAFSTFRSPEKIYASELWFPEGRLSNQFSTQTLSLGNVLLFLDPHPARGYVLSLYSSSEDDNDKALEVLLSYKTRLPLFWRSIGLLSNRFRCIDKTLFIGGQELSLPSLFPMGLSLGRLSELNNTDMSDYFAQALRLYRRLERAAIDASSLYQQSEVWRFEGRAEVDKALKSARIWKALLSSNTASQLCVPVVKKLPEPLRQLLQSPV